MGSPVRSKRLCEFLSQESVTDGHIFVDQLEVGGMVEVSTVGDPASIVPALLTSVSTRICSVCPAILSR